MTKMDKWNVSMQVSYVKSGYEIITNYNNSKDVDMQFSLEQHLAIYTWHKHCEWGGFGGAFVPTFPGPNKPELSIENVFFSIPTKQQTWIQGLFI